MPAASRLVWAPVAGQDLRDIWRYYARIASPDIADNLLREIGRAADRARENPLASRARDDVRHERRDFLTAFSTHDE
jgi:plasmid stabilization system protein ParE